MHDASLEYCFAAVRDAVNVQAAEKDPNSILNYFRKMIQLRKTEPVLVYGKFDLFDAE